MPTHVKRRHGRYPVRLSLNISEVTSDTLDRWERRLNRKRAQLARDALHAGLKLIVERDRKKKRRRSDFDEPSAPPPLAEESDALSAASLD